MDFACTAMQVSVLEEIGGFAWFFGFMQSRATGESIWRYIVWYFF